MTDSLSYRALCASRGGWRIFGSDAALPVVARLDADAEPDFAFSKGFAGGFPDLVLYEGGSPVAGFRGKRALPELKAFAARFGSNAGPADDLQCTARGN